jgi:hypothetical protein
MKRKGHREIPDFSSKRPGVRPVKGAKPSGDAPPPRPPSRTVKPQSTSAKSGRRGQ